MDLQTHNVQLKKPHTGYDYLSNPNDQASSIRHLAATICI
jgi:hypothetical protein